MTRLDTPSSVIVADDAERLIGLIAREVLGIATLATRNSDSLDFHDIAVWKLAAALRRAYLAGRNSALRQQQEDGTQSMTTRNITHAAIEANLAALAEGLREASTLATSAHAAMRADYRNLAIGTVLPLEQDLPTYVGLLTAILALHRRAGQGGAP